MGVVRAICLIFGIIFILIGLFLILTLGWLFGIGILFGGPLLIVGIVLAWFGSHSSNTQISQQTQKVEITVAKSLVQNSSDKGDITMAFCSKCGKETEKDADFCKSCGHNLK